MGARRAAISVATGIGGMVLAWPAAAAVVRIPGNAATLGAGIRAAVDGDTVLVAAGTWSDEDDRDLDFAGKRIVLRSELGASVTTIDCGEAGRAFLFASGETESTVVEGFRVTAGRADWGGAVYCANASPILRDCEFVDNAATSGGAVFLLGWVAPVLRDCVFRDNVATQDGGAIYGRETEAVIESCRFEGNRGRLGGAVHAGPWFEGAIRTCDFEDNVAEAGAAIRGYYFEGTVEGSTFSANLADEGGGLDLYESDVTIEACTFSRNSGGTITCFGGTPSFSRTIIYCPAGEPALVRSYWAAPTFAECLAWGPAGGGDVGASDPGVLALDPLLCGPWEHDLGLCAESPGLPEHNAWGAAIGAHGTACASCVSRVTEESWGRIKARWRTVW